MPVPSDSTTKSEKPRASPLQAWPSAARLTSLSTTKGTCRCSPSFETSGKPCQWTFGPPVATPVVGSTMAGTPTATAASGAPARSSRCVMRLMDSTSVSKWPPSASLGRTSSMSSPQTVGQHGVALGAAQVDADDAPGQGVEGDGRARPAAGRPAGLFAHQVPAHEPADGTADRRRREAQAGGDVRPRRAPLLAHVLQHQLLVELEHQTVADRARAGRGQSRGGFAGWLDIGVLLAFR